MNKVFLCYFVAFLVVVSGAPPPKKRVYFNDDESGMSPFELNKDIKTNALEEKTQTPPVPMELVVLEDIEDISALVYPKPAPGADIRDPVLIHITKYYQADKLPQELEVKLVKAATTTTAPSKIPVNPFVETFDEFS